ncbi:MAG: hypothetical protein JWQ53_591, partial [Klenkia sp.]|nr:hypothetical protein [Klenkia sp.]
MDEVIARAQTIADEVFFPAAGEVDAAGVVPAAHLETLAEAGLYGLTGPVGAGGQGADQAAVDAVVEALAGGDLATTFVWLQHLAVPRMVAEGPAALREEFLVDLCAGRTRSGIALLAATRPGPPAITVRREADGFVLDGGVPWVTGWAHVDVLLVAARDAADVVHFLLVDAVEGPTLTADPQRLVAVEASSTVQFSVRGHRVPATRLVRTVPMERWQA